ncbi:MAG: hypothetical protein ACKO2C_01635 [Actinomycetes bacterium]
MHQSDTTAHTARLEAVIDAQAALDGRCFVATSADLDRLDEVIPGLLISADLGVTDEERAERLHAWVSAGVTHYLDLRAEADDTEFIARHAPGIEVRRAPTHDDRTQKTTWFDEVLAAVGDLLDRSDVTLLVTCAAGVARAPSAVFRILLARGWGELEAIAAIAAARPAAEITYAPDAFVHAVLDELWGTAA